MDRYHQGAHEFEALLGSAPEDGLAELRLRSPYMYETLVEGIFGGPLTHVELSRAEREIATIAVLAASGGDEPQLALHIKGALHQGITPGQLRALCEHVAIYAGFPRGLNALKVVDAVLTQADIPRPPLLHQVRLSDHTTTVAQYGTSGPAVVLIHALGLDWHMWEPIMASLSAGRRVFAYDIRGHGAAAGSPNPFTMADTAKDLFGVFDALGLDKAHVVGLSYGGGIAQTAAVMNPKRFESLALLATTDYPFDGFEARARSGEMEGMVAQVPPSLMRWFTPQALALNGWGVRYARERILRNTATDWAAAWRTFKGLDVQGRLQDFKLPTLVLAGEHDASTTPQIMSDIAKRIAGSMYQELPGTPHMQTLECPELVAEALQTFLPTDAVS